jgi:hypothetical protein
MLISATDMPLEIFVYQHCRCRRPDKTLQLKTDLSVYNKLELEKPPVGVKFLFENLAEF